MSIQILEKTYEDIFTLAKEMYLHPTAYSQALRTPAMLDFVSSQDERKAKKLNALSLLSLPDDVFVFKAGELLNPFMAFRFHGYLFEDYASLGKALLKTGPNPDATLQSIIHYELTSEHMKTTLYDKTHQELYQKVRLLEKDSSQDLPFIYFSLGYLLSGFTGIIYDGLEYQDIYNLTYFLVKKEKDLDSLGAYLSFSPLLKAYSNYAVDGEKIKTYLHLCQAVDKSEKQFNLFLDKRKKKQS